MKKVKKEKMRLIIITLIIMGLIGSLVSSVSKDWVSILENKKEINKLSQEYENLLNNEEKLKSEVTKLQDNDYVARFAKEKYLYSSDGEIIIRTN